MNKICTSLEQSKKLIKLGIDINTADMFWHKKFDGTLSLRVDDIMVKLDTPAWSLTALLDILPSGKVLIHDKDTSKYKCICKNIDTNFYDNAVDDCYEMIVKLKEENVI